MGSSDDKSGADGESDTPAVEGAWGFPPFEVGWGDDPLWECPGGTCVCHPVEEPTFEHRIVFHDVFGERIDGVRCRIYEGTRMLVDESSTGPRGEVTVSVHRSTTVLRIEWIPPKEAPHPRLPYRKLYHVRRELQPGRATGQRLANIGFIKHARQPDNIRDYQRAYHEPETGALADVHQQLRDRHDQGQLPPFEPGPSSKVGVVGAKKNVVPAAFPGAAAPVVPAQHRPGGPPAGTPTAGAPPAGAPAGGPPAVGTAVPSAAHLTIGVSTLPIGSPLNPAQVTIRLLVKSVVGTTAVIVGTLLEPDIGQQTSHGAAFQFQHLPAGSYQALAYVRHSTATVAHACGELDVELSTGDMGGHKFVDMVVRDYTLRAVKTLVAPDPLPSGMPIHLFAQRTVGPVTWGITSGPGVVTSVPPLHTTANFVGSANGLVTVKATDLGGQTDSVTITVDHLFLLLVDPARKIGLEDHEVTVKEGAAAPRKVTTGPKGLIKLTTGDLPITLSNIEHPWDPDFVIKYEGVTLPRSSLIPHEVPLELRKSVIDEIAKSLSLIRRSTWGASKPRKTPGSDWAYTTIVIHHSGNRNIVDPKEIEKEHLGNKPPFDDVGYHYMVHPDGRIFEGRYLAHKGEHVALGNTGKIGVLVMGDFQPGSDIEGVGHIDFDADGENNLTSAQEAATLKVLRVLAAKIPTATSLGGHRDYKTTTMCPGDKLFKVLPGWRTKTGLGGP